jgi:hypothetical protein
MSTNPSSLVTEVCGRVISYITKIEVDEEIDESVGSGTKNQERIIKGLREQILGELGPQKF